MRAFLDVNCSLDRYRYLLIDSHRLFWFLLLLLPAGLRFNL